MKKWNVVLMFVVATVVLALVPVVQADVLDPMTLGSILDHSRDPLVGPGRWHDERDEVWPPVNSALKESAFSHDGDGSMMVDYGYWAEPYPPAPAGDPYDRVPRGYFEGEDNYAPPLPDLTGLQLTFWWWKGVATGGEHVNELIIYSPDGMARYPVSNGGEWAPGDPHYTGAATGWQFVTSALIGGPGWVVEGDLDLTAVTTIDFWCSAWHWDWEEIPPGSGNWVPIADQLMPSGEPIYIDDLRLIPEPATMSLLALGTLAMLKRRIA